MISPFIVTSVLFLFFGSIAQARVFDINRESSAAYFGVNGGPSFLVKSAFENEAGTNVTYSAGVGYNYAGEFGFLASSPYLSARFGFEIIKPTALENVVASGASGDLYSEASEVVGYSPKFGIEFNLRKTNDSRSFILTSMGYATVTLRNTYTLTSAGSAAYPGMSTILDARGGGALWAASLGQEMHLSDTTTFLFELGYRYLSIENLKYTNSGSYFGSSYASGDEVQNNGSARKLNLSGSFVGVTFRFYL